MELRVKIVAMDQNRDFMVLLVDREGKKVLPIWIDPFEAQAIALPLQKEAPLRPLTHDLFKNLCEQLQGKVERVVITDINPEGTYFSEIHLRYRDYTSIIDCRPSDAIALALRFKAPIYMVFKLVEFTINPENIFIQKSRDEET